MIGQTVSHYKVLERLGGGGMGVVYRAEDVRLARHVALKFLPADLSSDSVARQRFTREARSASALDHVHICTIYDIGETPEGGLFIAMAYYDGETLDRRIARGPIAPPEAALIAHQVADGLARAHQANIVHRDVKPANLMLTREGVVKILDFGIAKLPRSDRLTREGMAVGTLTYMSPEQARGEEPDPRSDLWSLGVVLYEMLTGEPPFHGKGQAGTLHAVLYAERPSLAEHLPEEHRELEGVVEKALTRDPQQRYRDAHAMSAALRRHASTVDTLVSIPVPTASHRVGAPKQPSVAVLPFTDLSSQQDQEYFCIGLAEELTLALTRVPGLQVTSRSSASRVAEREDDLETIGRKLGVRSVLEGTVRKEGPRLRVTSQLVDMEGGYNLWSERFDREFSDVFTIQEEIARHIVETLQLTLVGDLRAPGADESRQHPEAYNLYLEGRYFADKRTEEGLKRALDLYRQALDQAPDYARAWAGMADSYSLLGIYGLSPPRDVMPRAREAASRALDLDASLADAHASLGCVRSVYEWDWPKAEASYHKARELDPRHALTRHGYAVHCLMPSGRFEQALDELRRARDLDPLSPVILTSLGLPHYYARRYDEAVAAYRHALELDPNFGMAHFFLGRAFVEQGRYPEAIQALERAVELSGESPEKTAALAHVQAVAGDEKGARKLLEKLEHQADTRYVSPVLRSQVLVGLGRREAALESLEEALDLKAVDLVWVEHHPVFDDLRDESRFRNLLDRGGLTRTQVPRAQMDTLAEPLPWNTQRE